MKFTDLIKGRTAHFISFQCGRLVYELDTGFTFYVPVSELHGASVSATEKASVFMKWIKRTYDEIEESKRV